MGSIAVGEGVGGDDEIGLAHGDREGLPLHSARAMVHEHAEFGAEAARLVDPVAHDGHGDEQERRAGFRNGGRIFRGTLALEREEREELNGLAQAHVVGETEAESEAFHVVHPRDAAGLIGAECAVESVGGVDRLEFS